MRKSEYHFSDLSSSFEIPFWNIKEFWSICYTEIGSEILILNPVELQIRQNEGI